MQSRVPCWEQGAPRLPPTECTPMAWEHSPSGAASALPGRRRVRTTRPPDRPTPTCGTRHANHSALAHH
eukprot:2299409-Prymnesium_polylepis.1